MAATREAPSLEALVRNELRAPITELVRQLVPQLVAEALNGSTATPLEHAANRASSAPERTRTAAEGSGPAAKACASCGQQKPATAYERGRGVCRGRRQRQARERTARRATEQQQPAEPGRPAAIAEATLLSRVRRNGVRAPRLIRWLVDEGFAVRVDGGLVATEKTREIAAAID